MVTVWLAFWGTARLSSKAAAPFSSRFTAGREGSHPRALASTCSDFLIPASQVVCVFPRSDLHFMATDAEYPFLCLSASPVSSLRKCLLRSIWSPPQGAAVSSAGNSVLRGHLLPLPLPPAPPPQSWPAHLLGGAAFSWLPSLVLSVDCPVWLGLETSVCCPTFALGPWTPLLQKSKTLGTQALSRSHGKSKFTRQIQGHSW